MHHRFYVDVLIKYDYQLHMDGIWTVRSGRLTTEANFKHQTKVLQYRVQEVEISNSSAKNATKFGQIHGYISQHKPFNNGNATSSWAPIGR